MTRRRSLAVVAIAAVGTVALAAGIAQGSSGSDGDTQVATIDAAVAAADVRLCPGAAPVGQLDPGDTVALTGRSEDGAWLQLRSPTDEDERVWIDATLVVVTTTPEELPIVRCGAVDLAIELIGGAELGAHAEDDHDHHDHDDDTPAGGATTTTAGGTDHLRSRRRPDDHGDPDAGWRHVTDADDRRPGRRRPPAPAPPPPSGPRPPRPRRRPTAPRRPSTRSP